jgi:hypothetical protein
MLLFKNDREFPAGSDQDDVSEYGVRRCAPNEVANTVLLRLIS